MSVNLKAIFEADKELSSDPDWKRRSKDEFVRLVSPIEIDGVTVEGLRFTASAHIYTPDRWVTFQMEHESIKFPKGVAFVRFEWRPRSPHNNKGIGPEEFRHTVIGETHIHPFQLNWAHSEAQVRKGSLPIAVPVLQQLDDYNAALAFVENEFRIKGVSGLPVPPWMERHGWE